MRHFLLSSTLSLTEHFRRTRLARFAIRGLDVCGEYKMNLQSFLAASLCCLVAYSSSADDRLKTLENEFNRLHNRLGAELYRMEDNSKANEILNRMSEIAPEIFPEAHIWQGALFYLRVLTLPRWIQTEEGKAPNKEFVRQISNVVSNLELLSSANPRAQAFFTALAHLEYSHFLMLNEEPRFINLIYAAYDRTSAIDRDWYRAGKLLYEISLRFHPEKERRLRARFRRLAIEALRFPLDLKNIPDLYFVRFLELQAITENAAIDLVKKDAKTGSVYGIEENILQGAMSPGLRRATEVFRPTPKTLEDLSSDQFLTQRSGMSEEEVFEFRMTRLMKQMRRNRPRSIKAVLPIFALFEWDADERGDDFEARLRRIELFLRATTLGPDLHHSLLDFVRGGNYNFLTSMGVTAIELWDLAPGAVHEALANLNPLIQDKEVPDLIRARALKLAAEIHFVESLKLQNLAEKQSQAAVPEQAQEEYSRVAFEKLGETHRLLKQALVLLNTDPTHLFNDPTTFEAFRLYRFVDIYIEPQQIAKKLKALEKWSQKGIEIFAKASQSKAAVRSRVADLKNLENWMKGLINDQHPDAQESHHIAETYRILIDQRAEALAVYPESRELARAYLDSVAGAALEASHQKDRAALYRVMNQSATLFGTIVEVHLFHPDVALQAELTLRILLDSHAEVAQGNPSLVVGALEKIQKQLKVHLDLSCEDSFR